MRKRILPVLAVLVIVAAAYAVWASARSAKAAASQLGGSGTIEATNVSVSSQMQLPARIIAASVKAGEPVKKGQTLFKLDSTLAKYQVAQAEAGVRAAQTQLSQDKDDDKARAVIANDQAQLDQAAIQVEITKTQAAYAVVKSPIDGVALDVPANLGENATPGQTLSVLGDIGHLTVSIYVPESQIGQVKIGQKGTLTIDSTGSKTFPCVVTSVASQAEFTPASVETKDQRVKLVYEVKLDVTDSTGVLKPGMPADVSLLAWTP